MADEKPYTCLRIIFINKFYIVVHDKNFGFWFKQFLKLSTLLGTFESVLGFPSWMCVLIVKILLTTKKYNVLLMISSALFAVDALIKSETLQLYELGFNK